MARSLQPTQRSASHAEFIFIWLNGMQFSPGFNNNEGCMSHCLHLSSSNMSGNTTSPERLICLIYFSQYGCFVTHTHHLSCRINISPALVHCKCWFILSLLNWPICKRPACVLSEGILRDNIYHNHHLSVAAKQESFHWFAYTCVYYTLFMIWWNLV